MVDSDDGIHVRYERGKNPFKIVFFNKIENVAAIADLSQLEMRL